MNKIEIIGKIEPKKDKEEVVGVREERTSEE